MTEEERNKYEKILDVIDALEKSRDSISLQINALENILPDEYFNDADRDEVIALPVPEKIVDVPNEPEPEPEDDDDDVITSPVSSRLTGPQIVAMAKAILIEETSPMTASDILGILQARGAELNDSGDLARLRGLLKKDPAVRSFHRRGYMLSNRRAS